MDLIGAWMCGRSRLSEHTEPHTILSEKYYSPVCVCVLKWVHFISCQMFPLLGQTPQGTGTAWILLYDQMQFLFLNWGTRKHFMQWITVLSVLNCHWNVTRVEHAHVTSRSLHLLQTKLFSPVLNKLCVFCVGVCILYVGVFEERHQEAQVLNIEGENN